LAKRGTPAGLIGTTAFQGLAVSEMGAQGVSALPLLIVEHPLGGERPEAIARRAQQAFEQLSSIVAGSARPVRSVGGLSEAAVAPHAESFEPIMVGDDPIAILEEFSSRNWETAFQSLRRPRSGCSGCSEAATGRRVSA
jgi:hypothetical protein